MKSIYIVLLCGAIVLSTHIGVAQIPHTISYQGYYTSNGQPVTGTYTMNFKFYTQPSGGSSTWSSGNSSVQISKGVYSVVLDVSVVTFDRQYWLETTINNVTSSTRTQLTGVPYSLAPWNPKDSNVYFSGGNVGIGTATPQHRLSIAGGPAWTSNGWRGAAALGDASAIAWQTNSAGQRFGIGHTFGGLYFFRTSSDPGSTASAATYDMLISDNGNVGIGNTLPGARLDVEGQTGMGAGWGIHVNGYSTSYGALEARNAWGGNGINGSAAGINGLSGIGVRGSSSTNFGVAGISDTIGVYGEANSTNHGTGVVGKGSMTGGYFEATLGNGWAGIFNGRVQANLLQINGGSDLAEPFDVESEATPEPGSVVVIDPQNPGKLTISTTAYDSKVAGVISGAGGIKPGLTLRQEGVADGNNLIAIAGRVYCRAEALSSPIEPGDILTTSSIPGYAMKAVERDRANGAAIGKAMTGLKQGKGLILVLVNLQ